MKYCLDIYYNVNFTKIGFSFAEIMYLLKMCGKKLMNFNL